MSSYPSIGKPEMPPPFVWAGIPAGELSHVQEMCIQPSFIFICFLMCNFMTMSPTWKITQLNKTGKGESSFALVFNVAIFPSITGRCSNWGGFVLDLFHKAYKTQKSDSSITRRSANRRRFISPFKLGGELVPIQPKPQVVCHVLQILLDFANITNIARSSRQRCQQNQKVSS